jgi:hypothetical protein
MLENSVHKTVRLPQTQLQRIMFLPCVKKIFICAFLLNSAHCFAKTYFVNSSAVGSNDGASWQNAYTDLQSALAVVSSGDTIKVAAGTYKPSLSSPSISFIIKRGIQFFGGYPNSGNPSDADRNWVNQRTILSAKLVQSYSNILIRADNIDTLTTVDGFIMQEARGSGETRGIANGLQITNSTHLFIRNTIFENSYGASIGLSNSTAVFFNCVVDKNDAFGAKAVVYNTANSSTSFYNSIFTGNRGFDGLFTEAVIVNVNSLLNLINCDLVGNNGPVVYGSGSGSTNIINSIFWNNLKEAYSFEDGDIKLVGQSSTIHHSITQSYFDTSVNTIKIAANPNFFNLANPAGSDNKFFTSDDGLQLTNPCSPGLNSGDNSLLTGISSDVLGNPRIFNNGTVDLGAYEMQGAVSPIQKTVYVNSTPNNTGNNDGSSWQNAFRTLQQALLYCADTIKISAGVYFTTNSRTNRIFFLENKKILLGGYPSIGSPLDTDRKPDVYRTLLKGNFDSASTGYTFPVLKAYGNDSSIIDGLSFTNELPNGNPSSFALIVGYRSRIRIENCNFSVTPNQGRRSIGVSIGNASEVIISKSKFSSYVTEGGGTALGIGNSKVTINSCTFIGETSQQQRSGGAISIGNSQVRIDSCNFLNQFRSVNGDIVEATNSKLDVSNCVFRNIHNNGSLISYTSNSSGLVENCIFKNIDANFSPYFPPALLIDHSNPSLNKCLFDSSENNFHIENKNYAAPTFNNCVFVSGRFMKNSRSYPVVNHSTIVQTYISPPYTDEIELVINNDSSTFHANNTIFWSHKLQAGSKDIADNDPMFPSNNSISILNNCLTQNYGQNGVNGNKVGENPRFVQLTDIDGPDNQMFTADDGIQLAKCSPAINAGNNSIGNVLSTDILGNPRQFNTTDIGAYELQVAPGASNIYYVRANASGTNNGESWQNAYTNLQSAICNACGDTIKIAAGAYKPAVSNRDSIFLIDRPVVLLGGYPSTGNPTDLQRDPYINQTILDGNIGNQNDSLDNASSILAVIGIKDSAIIDGLVIKSAYYGGGPIAINGTGGGGLFTYYCKTYIKDCQFINNRSSPYGGGAYIGSLSNANFFKTIFQNNSSTNEAGALMFKGNSITINSCVFEKNYSYGKGGAIGLSSSTDYSPLRIRIFNSVFYKNYTEATNVAGQGGAIFVPDFTAGSIFNCTFVENSTTYYNISSLRSGGAISLRENLAFPIDNCIFKGNSAGTSNTVEGADIDWGVYNTVHNSLLQGPPRTVTSNIYGASPRLTDSIHLAGADLRWFTNDDGIQLQYNSPAINYGNNNIVSGLPNDFLQNRRIVNGVVDAGASEYQNLAVAKAGNDTTICTGTSVQIGRAGNPNHIYSWTSSPAGFISNSSTPTVSPAVTTTYFLEANNGTQTARDTVVVSLSNSLSPTVTIISSATSVCQGAAVTYTAIPNGEGTLPSYQWRLNGANAGTNSPNFTATSLTNGSQVTLIMTSSAGCAAPTVVTSNVITEVVNPVVIPSVGISTPTTSVCSETPVTFTATPVNGGSHPIYEWISGGFRYAVTTTNVWTTNNVQSATYVRMTSNAACANPVAVQSSPINVTVATTNIPSVSINASSTIVCPATTVNFTSTIVNGGTAPIYQWKKNGLNIPGANSSTYAGNNFLNGDLISVQLTSNANCAAPFVVNSTAIYITVGPGLESSVSISGNTVLNQAQTTTLSSQIANGGSSPLYQWQDSTVTHSWQDIIGATTSTLNYTPQQTGNKIRCKLTSNMACVSQTIVYSGTLTFTVNTTTSVRPEPATNSGIVYYPNPVASTFTIDSLKLTDRWQSVEILSLDGKQRLLTTTISNQRKVNILVGRLPQGLYLARIRSKSGAIVYLKFIKI